MEVHFSGKQDPTSFTADDVQVIKSGPKDILLFQGNTFQRSVIARSLEAAGVEFAIILFLESGETMEKLTDEQLQSAGLKRI